MFGDYSARVRGFIRHLATFGGGFLVAQGYVDQDTVTAAARDAESILDQLDTIAGAAMMIYGTGHSWLDKAKKRNEGDPA